MATREVTVPRTEVASPRRRVNVAVVRDYGVVIAFAALFVTLSITSGAFLTWSNLKNLAFQSAPLGIIAIGGTFVFIAGGFDLSVGASSGFAAIIAGKLFLSTGIGVWPSMAIGALVGLGCGVGNGLLVTVGRVNAFIATLATSIIIYGFAQVITGGNLVSVDANSWSTLGLGNFLGIGYPVYVWLVFALVGGFLLSRTMFGRYTYAVGGNREAARLAGVRVDIVRATTFAFSGLAAGVAGVILFSEVGTAQWNANSGIEFDSITAIVLGGTSLLGGEGAIWRTVLGAFFLQMIGNGFDLLGTTPQWQYVIKGLILAAAVSLDAWARRSRA
ncbi:MAG: ABC transporter permease [Solirubrobacterales bacterium]|nr:ABC transporter permease [Solirubrobacterales bacterium]MBV9050033.1 ABC transporter permease [Solirubrobacterales bacterium]